MPSEQATQNEKTTSEKTTWQIDPAHTGVEFAVKHMMFATVKGRFGGVTGTITRDGDRLVAVEAAIPAETVDTGTADRDAHLKSPDFFDVENHPSLRFESRQVEEKGDGKYEVEGDLTIRGVTKPVTLDVTLLGEGTDPWGGTRAGAEATTKINRKDFGLNWNQALEAGGWLVGNEIRITIDVQAVKQE